MEKWAGELANMGVDTLLRHLAAMISVLRVWIPSRREFGPTWLLAPQRPFDLVTL